MPEDSGRYTEESQAVQPYRRNNAETTQGTFTQHWLLLWVAANSNGGNVYQESFFLQLQLLCVHYCTHNIS